jgi:hypothetical protein
MKKTEQIDFNGGTDAVEAVTEKQVYSAEKSSSTVRNNGVCFTETI